MTLVREAVTLAQGIFCREGLTPAGSSWLLTQVGPSLGPSPAHPSAHPHPQLLCLHPFLTLTLSCCVDTLPSPSPSASILTLLPRPHLVLDLPADLAQVAQVVGLRVEGEYGSLAMATTALRHWPWGRAAASSTPAILARGRRLWNRPPRSLPAG